MPTADDDSVPVSHDEFRLPRALLNWGPASQRGFAEHPELDSQPTPVSGRGPFVAADADVYAASDEFDEDPTVAMPAVTYPIARFDAPEDLPRHETAHAETGLARAAQLWRDYPLRTAGIVAGVALVTYLAVDGLRDRRERSSQTIVSPAAAVRVGVPIVEQLTEVSRPHETVGAPPRAKPMDAPGTRSVARRPRGAVAASNNSDDHASAAAQPKPAQAERSRASMASSSAGLPAWGAAAVRDFSETKRSKAASAPTASTELTEKPASPSTDATLAPAAEGSGAREESKTPPAVAAKAAEPPEPAAAPRPSTPLTMEQMLNQVEEAAQARRKKAGLKATASSESDAELEALINGAMKMK